MVTRKLIYDPDMTLCRHNIQLTTHGCKLSNRTAQP